jgi:hypothetical protein
MNIPNPHWPRWIFASAADHFRQAADGIELPILIEGVDERETEKMCAGNHVEFRLNGPAVTELSRGYFRLDVDVNLLLTSMMGGQVKNAYDIVQQAGVLLQAAGHPIPVHKFGNGPDDDQSLVGCLTLRSGKRDAVRVIHFGQLGRSHRLRQCAVDARYHLFLSTNGE